MYLTMYWPECTYKKGRTNYSGVGSYWVECTREESERLIFPFLSRSQVQTSKKIYQQEEGPVFGIDADRACFLVSEDLRLITPLPWYYPHSEQRKGTCRFVGIPKTSVEKLEDILYVYKTNGGRGLKNRADVG